MADLNPPKTIHDWQVVAKVLRELPDLHPKFQEAARFLSLQRKLLQRETTLQECQHAFVSADIDNDIHGDLHARGRRKGSPKKRLRANNSNLSPNPTRRVRFQDDRDGNSNTGKFKAGDCVHHPTVTTHTTNYCKNPFGLRSIFGKAQSYHDKCITVKTSVEAGWSKRATNVKIPQGYGFDLQGNPTNDAPITSAIPPDPVHANLAAIPNDANLAAINEADMRAYNKVRNFMAAQSKSTPPSTANPRPPPPPAQQHVPHGGYHHPVISSVRAFHAAVPYPFQAHPHLPARPPVYPAPVHPYAHPYMSPYAGHPAPVRSNAATMPQPPMPPPTDDDLIAAGMRYYATQSGHQNFH